ncbi:MAG: hypothetical protein JRJ38_15685 [Deltaproteobacteria bacterium]|nr:hypothetical protein [Deltaproteobacteria bacterium]
MLDTFVLPFVVTPACHARPGIYGKNRLLVLFRAWLKKQMRVKARAGRSSTYRPASKDNERKVTLNL